MNALAPLTPQKGWLHNLHYRTLSCSTKVEMSGFSKVEMSGLDSTLL